MAYYLTVTTGVDEGKTFTIDRNECVIGRSPTAGVVLRDDSVAWEHARLRMNGGKLYIENLSANGTKVRGQRVKDEVRLHARDSVELSDRCRVIVEQRLQYGEKKQSTTLLLVALVALLLVMVVGGFMLTRPSEPPQRPVTQTHWRQAYARIDERLVEWHGRGQFPMEGIVLYRDAWRYEQVGNFAQAGRTWAKLRSILMALPAPVGEDGEERTFAELAAADRRPLGVIMGWERHADFDWTSDQSYAQAFAWFVRLRAQSAQTRAGS